MDEPTIKNYIYFSKRTIFTIKRIPGISFLEVRESQGKVREFHLGRKVGTLILS